MCNITGKFEMEPIFQPSVLCVVLDYLITRGENPTKNVVLWLFAYQDQRAPHDKCVSYMVLHGSVV